MMEFMRTIFGNSSATGNRKVVGNLAHQYDSKDTEHIRESEAKLTTLYHLYKKYAGSAHEHKIRLAYEKTKNIHHYMVAHKRVHELTLFHLQHTDHFINTFGAIVDLYQKHNNVYPPSPGPAAGPKARPQGRPVNEKGEAERKNNKSPIPEIAEMLKTLFVEGAEHMKNHRNGHNWRGQGQGQKQGQGPELNVPEVTINTFEKFTYHKDLSPGALMVKEVSYISTVKEKEDFLQYISGRLGIQDISYLGNAMVSIPGTGGAQKQAVVPVIHWKDFLYAVEPVDFRLFPVRMYRRG